MCSLGLINSESSNFLASNDLTTWCPSAPWVTWQDLRWIHLHVCQTMSRRYVLELMRNHVTLKIVTIETIWKIQPGLCQRNMSMCSNKSSHKQHSSQICYIWPMFLNLTSFDLRSTDRPNSLAALVLPRQTGYETFTLSVNRFWSDLTLIDLIWP